MKNLCLIIGLGKTGKSAYNFLLKKGYLPIFYDDIILNIDVEWLLPQCGFVLPSPGVNPSHQILLNARQLKIPILSLTEIMFLFRTNKEIPIIGITGTNGKTTVTSMIGSVLENCFVGGNIGTPWTEAREEKIQVIELSSFELDRINKFHPNIFVVLNIAPDHIDYHGSFDNYIKAKLKPIKNMSRDDVLVYCGEDKNLVGMIENISCKKYYFSIKKSNGDGVFVNEKDEVVFSINGESIVLFNLDGINFFGSHNLLNILASSIVCYLCGESGQKIKEKLIEYKYYPFRLEQVKNKKGLNIINDSKSTNLASTIAALSIAKDNIILLVGGEGKSEDYSKLFDYKDKIKMLLVYGKSKKDFIDCAIKTGNHHLVVEFNDMRSAVKYAIDNCFDIDTILFSPACASFDEFSSYKERGNVFNKMVDDKIGIID